MFIGKGDAQIIDYLVFKRLGVCDPMEVLRTGLDDHPNSEPITEPILLPGHDSYNSDEIDKFANRVVFFNNPTGMQVSRDVSGWQRAGTR